MEDLIKFLNAICPLSEMLKEHLVNIVRFQTVNVNEYLLKEGKICERIYFIRKGLFRNYNIDDGLEICTWILKEGDIIVSVLSFFDQIPSYEYIQALEPAEVYSISFKEFRLLTENFSEFNTIRGNRMEHYYKARERRFFSILKHSAEQRLQDLFENHADIVERVPDKFLASFIGLNPSTFSRNKPKYFKRLGVKTTGGLH